MKIVLDSNILLVSIGKASRFKPIWIAFLTGSYKLIVSEDVLFEYEEILQRNSAVGASDLMIEILNESPDVFTSKYIIRGTL